MVIAMDGREALQHQRTGKGQWACGFLQELNKRHTELIMLSGSHVRIALKLLRKRPNLYLSPTSYILPSLIGRWIPCAIVVHDLIAFRKEPHDIKAKWIERLTLPWALRFSKYVFTVSEATKRDLLERFSWIDERKVTVIYAGGFQPSPKPSPFKGRGDKPYILCVGTLCPRKNQLRLIEAFEKVMTSNRVILRCTALSCVSRLTPFAPQHDKKGQCLEGQAQRSSDTIDIKLILAGSRGWHDEVIVQKAKNTPHVTWLGHISDGQYQELLASATIFALPSLYEGFGLAVLDAMAMGTPVLTSDRGSLREVAGDAALYCNPENRDSIAEGLERLLTDDDLRHQLSEKGKQQAQRFSWRKTVDLFLESIVSH